MIEPQKLFVRYCSNESGAFAVLFTFVLSVLLLVFHVGYSTTRIQNGKTSAEQMVDLACQKIAEADPALYATPDAVVAAIKAQLQTREANLDATPNGIFTITYTEKTNFVTPLSADGANADLRRFIFTVTYDGEVKGIDERLDPSKKAAIGAQRVCRPQCNAQKNVIYENPAAIGHWMDGRTFKAASVEDRTTGALSRYTPVSFSRNVPNPARNGSRFVMTIMDQDFKIRYRRVVSLPEKFYIDDNAQHSPGEPSGMVQRYVVDASDQLFVQKLNADGSVPPGCPSTSPDDDGCVNNCSPSVPPPPPVSTGTPNPPPQRVYQTDNCIVRDYRSSLPINLPDGRYRQLPRYNPAVHTVDFAYPVGRNPGSLTMRANGSIALTELVVPLAPDYIPFPTNLTVMYNGQWTLSSTGAQVYIGQTTQMKAEQYSALRHLTSSNFLATFQDIYNRYPEAKMLFHLQLQNYTFWWDPDTDVCIKVLSPIVFDMKGLGEIYTTVHPAPGQPVQQSPLFDFDGFGKRERVEWPIGEGQAWLVDNRDGRAAEDMNGRRFFGNGTGFEDGYQMLATLDSSGTGILSGRDLDGLALWFDNGNARVEPGELRPVKELGITAISARGERKSLANGRTVLRSEAWQGDHVIMTEDILVKITRDSERANAMSEVGP